MTCGIDEGIRFMTLVMSIALIIAATGCGSAMDRPVRVHLTPAESIDPFAYGDEFVRPDSGSTTSPPAAAQQDQQDGIPADQTMPPQQITRPLPVPGGIVYRIQLSGTFADRDEAELYARSARNRLDSEITVEYRAPFYRVYAGSFSTERDAESYIQQLREKGFRESRWVFESPTAQ